MKAPARLFVVVTGLAGSGKTTVAESLGPALGLAVISKDAIKEALFEAVGWGGWERSKTLSRAADAALMALAEEAGGAVLDNFWRASTAPTLLAPLGGEMVEVWCRCAPDTARRRFEARTRHPGHADDENKADTAGAGELRFPIDGLGPVVELDTENPVDVAELADRVRTAAAADAE